MPLACANDTTVLTGQSGLVMFSPAATQFCLQDFADFTGAQSWIVVPMANDYRIGDPIQFQEEDGGNLDSALTAGTKYFVVDKGASGKYGQIKVSATKGGPPVVLAGDGGNGAMAGGVPSSLGAFVPGLPTTSGNYGAGPYTGVATSTTTGSGAGLTVDVTVAAGDVTAIAVGTVAGTGYGAGDEVRIAGDLLGGTAGTDDIVLQITAASAITGGDSGGHVEIRYFEAEALCDVANIEISYDQRGSRNHSFTVQD